MKYLFPALLALFVGYQIGHWSPKWESNVKTQRIDELQLELKTKGSGGRGGLGLPFISNQAPEGPRREVKTNTVEKVVLVTNEVNVVVTQLVTQAQVSTNEVKESRRDRRERWEKMDGRERMDEMVELWEVRSDMARNAFFNNIEASEEDVENFELIVSKMNYGLEQYLNSWADEVENKDDLYPEDGLKMMRNVMGYVELGYDQMADQMPSGWRENAGQKFQLFDFINPSVGESIIRLEDSGKDLKGLQGGPGNW